MVKQLVKIVIIIAALFTAMCAAACTQDRSFPSVASVAGEWLAIKREINAAHIDGFRQTVARFLASPVGSLYTVHKPEEMRSFEAIIPALEQLNAAVTAGDNQAVFALALEIDARIDLLATSMRALPTPAFCGIFSCSFSWRFLSSSLFWR